MQTSNVPLEGFGRSSAELVLGLGMYAWIGYYACCFLPYRMLYDEYQSYRRRIAQVAIYRSAPLLLLAVPRCCCQQSPVVDSPVIAVDGPPLLMPPLPGAFLLRRVSMPPLRCFGKVVPTSAGAPRSTITLVLHNFMLVYCLPEDKKHTNEDTPG